MGVTRVVTDMGTWAVAAITARFPDIEVVAVDTPEPPPGLRADVFYGGWTGKDRLGTWADATGVQWVQLSGTGVDGIPADLIERHVVCAARGASATPISEFVLAAMLAFEKQMPGIWLHEPPEHWNLASLGGLAGRTAGIVGFGGIGQAVAVRAQAFDMRVVAVRRTDTPSPIAGVEMVPDLAALLPVADHLVLAAPATARTRHLIDAAALDRVKEGVHLVNAARGSLVDQEALRAALDDGRVAMATLDCVEPEPLPAGHWLYSHRSVRLSAHVSWSSPDGLQRSLELLLENIVRVRAGEDPAGIVDPVEGY